MVFPFLLAIIDYFDLNERRIPILCILFLCILYFIKIVPLVLRDGNDIGKNLIWDFLLTTIILLPMVAIYFLWKGSIGLGDLVLLVVSGIYIGHERILLCLFCTFFFFCLFSLAVLCKGGSKKQTLPFAPFLFIGYIACLLFEFFVT